MNGGNLKEVDSIEEILSNSINMVVQDSNITKYSSTTLSNGKFLHKARYQMFGI